MGIPTKIAPFISTGLFSVPGKARAALDFVLPASKPKEDQSLGEFFRRRVGDEVVENLIEPLLSGIYAGDIDKLSLMSTFPQFYQTEQKHRSLILGMKKSRPRPSGQQTDSQKAGPVFNADDRASNVGGGAGKAAYADKSDERHESHPYRPRGERIFRDA